VLGAGVLMRHWRFAALASGMVSSALLVVVGCANITEGAPTADRTVAAGYRTSMSVSRSQSASLSSERESTRQASLTAEAVATSCETLSSTSVDVVTAINSYVHAVSTNNPAEVEAKAQAAVDTLNHGADVVEGTLNSALSPQMADELSAWVDATRAVSRAIGERYAQPEFNAEVDKFNTANHNALGNCGGGY
jgi:hypothetical protein